MPLLFERVEKREHLGSMEIGEGQHGRRPSKPLLAETQEQPERVPVAGYRFGTGIPLFHQVFTEVSLDEGWKVCFKRCSLELMIAPLRRRKRSAQTARLPCS
jgi:hypothetical protein